MGEKKYELDQVAIRMVREKPLYSTEPIDSPEKAVKLLAESIRDYDREVVCVINLNSALQPINLNICSMGAIDRAIVSPREVLKSSILSNATSVMLFHNHPSGNCQPSDQDVYITDRMQEVYDLMGIKMLDHIIIGERDYYSFTENKVMPENQFSLTSIMELYQMKHGLEAQREAVIKEQKKLEEAKGSKAVAESSLIYDVLETDTSEFKPAHEIAKELIDWRQDYDIYGYNDSVDDVATAVRELEEQIVAGQTGDIKEYIQEAIDEGDPEDKIIIKAKKLLKDLDDYKPLAKVEEIEEQNYNMIDNRINNVETKEEKTPQKKAEKKEKRTTADKKYPGGKFGNFKIEKQVKNIRFALIADVKMPDETIHENQIIGEFKDKASVEAYCKQNNIAYDDITNYLQNMIEHKKLKVNEREALALEQGSPKLGRKGRERE